MGKQKKKISSHLFLYIGILCLSFFGYCIAFQMIMEYNATLVQGKITKIVTKEESLHREEQSALLVNKEPGIYVSYQIEEKEYRNCYLPRGKGNVNETISFFVNKMDHTKIFVFSSNLDILLYVIAVEGVLCIIIDLFLLKRRRNRERKEE